MNTCTRNRKPRKPKRSARLRPRCLPAFRGPDETHGGSSEGAEGGRPSVPRDPDINARERECMERRNAPRGGGGTGGGGPAQ